MSRTFEVVERLRAAGTTILMVEQMARQALRVWYIALRRPALHAFASASS